jgi:hypothetical protein
VAGRRQLESITENGGEEIAYRVYVGVSKLEWECLRESKLIN